MLSFPFLFFFLVIFQNTSLTYLKTLVFTQIGNNACIKSLTKNYPQRLQYFF